MNSQMQLFISYAFEDLDKAKQIYNDLKYKRLKAWIDSEDLLPGQNWKIGITNAIRNSSYFIALLSSNSVSKRGFIQKELKYAKDILKEFPQNDIYIIPVRLDDKIEKSDLDEELSALEWVDFSSSYDIEKLLKGIESKALNIERKDSFLGILIYKPIFTTDRGQTTANTHFLKFFLDVTI